MYYTNLTPEEMTRMHPCEKATCVITTSDSRMETLSDIADGVQPVGNVKAIEPPPATTSSSSSSTQHKDDDDDIDELDAIKEDYSELPDFTMATSQEQPMTEKKNGFNNHDNNKIKNQKKDNDNECCVNCLYFTQQCCECVIL